MWRILAALPSLIVRVTSTRLRSSLLTEGEISTLYLPRLLYWRVSSWVTRSGLRRLKVSPSDRPMSARPLSSASCWVGNGRGSCGERGCQYVETAGVGGIVKKQNTDTSTELATRK